MQCIKTGCDVFVIQTGEFIHGDAHQTRRGDLVIRGCGRRNEPAGTRRHFTVIEYEHVFPGSPETVFIQQGMYENHGYEGIDEPALAQT